MSKGILLICTVLLSLNLTGCNSDSDKVSLADEKVQSVEIEDNKEEEILQSEALGDEKDTGDLTSEEIRELISKLSNGEIAGKKASINSQQLIIVDERDVERERDIQRQEERELERKSFEEGEASIETDMKTEEIKTKNEKLEIKKEIIDISKEDFFIAIAPYTNQTKSCTEYNLTDTIGEMKNEDFEIKVEDLDGNIVIEETVKTGKNGFINLWLPRNKQFLLEIKNTNKKADAIIPTFEEDVSCITVIKLN